MVYGFCSCLSCLHSQAQAPAAAAAHNDASYLERKRISAVVRPGHRRLVIADRGVSVTSEYLRRSFPAIRDWPANDNFENSPCDIASCDQEKKYCATV